MRVIRSRLLIIGILLVLFTILSGCAQKPVEEIAATESDVGEETAVVGSDVGEEKEATPPVLYELKVRLKCEANPLFDRYSLDVYIDGQKQNILAHGAEMTYALEVSEGTHWIKVSKLSDSGISTDICIENLTADTEVFYKLIPSADRIEAVEVTNELVNENKEEVVDELVNENKEEVVDELANENKEEVVNELANENKEEAVDELANESREEYKGELDKMAVYRSITMEEAKEIFKTPGEYMILDVRRADEYAQGHIPGAVNVANEEIQTTNPKELPDMAQTVYVYCRSGRRSKEAAEKLVAMGYTGIIECGGILDWDGEIEK